MPSSNKGNKTPVARTAVVIGGGHNGLVAAAMLAKAGLSVTVLEADGEVGGGARTVEIMPGVRVPGLAHVLHLLHPQVISELDLDQSGLQYAAPDIDTVALDARGRNLVISRDRGELAGKDLAAGEQAAWARLNERLSRFAGALAPMLAEPPPRLASSNLAENLKLARLGLRIRRLGRADMREFLRIALMNVADLLDEELTDERLRGAVAFDAVLGSHLGPRSPGSVLGLLYRMAGEVLGERGARAIPQGGMGGVVKAIAEAGERAGVRTVVSAPVERIIVRGDRAVGVELATGDEIAADLVVSAIDPRTTFLDLVGVEHLDIGFTRRVRNIRARGNVAKLHLVLDGLPSFNGLDRLNHDGRLVVAPSVEAVERAFNPAKYGQYSPEPLLEMTIPSIVDPTLAPPGKHVLSALVQFAPYDLAGGWDGAREKFADLIVATIARYAPQIQNQIAHRELLTPVDIERRYRMPGGHWHHGELAPDQMLMLRPVPGAAQYDTPIPGLYLCGAGCHPGGGVTGVAGLNAARRILAKEKRA
ncbi:MAG: NAD(P)-binding protein [Rhizobiales bacterium]|nr:NAD(P)-binding protein [Hyphomicrobiales bacterium]